MKTLKKFLAVALALALCALCAVPALAANDPAHVPVPGETVDPNATYNLTLSNPQAGHEYEVYQLLTGVPSFEKDAWTLSNPAYGKDTNWDNGGKSVADTMEQLTAMQSNSSEINTFVAGLPFNEMVAFKTGTVATDAPLTWEVPGGYYVIRDVTAVTDENKDEALSAIMVTVVGAVSVNTKTTTTTSEKKVDASTGEGANPDWKDAAQKEVGKEFKFRLTAKVSTKDLDKYTTEIGGKGGFYKLVFNDTMSAGLDFVKFDTFKVLKTDGATANGTDVVGSDITSVVPANNQFSVTVPNLFDTIGKETTGWNDYKDTDGNIVVELIYIAKLNSKAVVYPEVIDGKPNWNDFTLNFSRDPSTRDDKDLGETPKDEVYVYTFKIDATKVKGDTNPAEPLAGAGFKLYKADSADAVTDTTPAMKFKLETEGQNAGKYVVSNAEGAVEEVFSAEETGTFNFAGLEAGTYVLVETTTPAGYNTMAPMVITITATVDGANNTPSATVSQSATQGGDPVTPDTTTEGIFKFQVVNNKGSILPSTGGIGTTIFYLVGGALVIGAGVLLFTKKRMHSKG